MHSPRRSTRLSGAGPRRGSDREQGRQPSREVAPGHVPIARRPDPASDEPQPDQVLLSQLSGVHRVLDVQQADIVLAPLAHHRLAGAYGGIGIDRSALALDLPLQRTGVGRNPDARTVGPGPQRGRREIAEGLADPGASFRQHHHRLAVSHPRLKGERDLGRVFRLPRARFVEAGALEKFGQPRGRFFRVDRPRTLALRAAPDPPTRRAGSRRRAPAPRQGRPV